jgi:two-component system, OmpR family, sensor histidine kinase KdpD
MGSVPQPHRGELKILLGYAAGVGKTYRMLEEGLQLKASGVDVVIGYFEPHGRKDTIAKTEGLELIPRRRVEYRGAAFEEMDIGAILALKPQVCLVDEFAHTNVPGSERAKRWEDVLVMLDAGIDVFTTMNIQHLESVNDQVRQTTGIQVRETVPDWVMKEAGEIVVVDLPPAALIHRLQRGVIYAPEKAASALENFFQESNLGALREMALRQAAHQVDVLRIEGSAASSAAGPAVTNDAQGTGPAAEKFMIYVTDRPSTAQIIRRAWRVADYLQAECLAVYIRSPFEPKARYKAVERHLNFARDLHIETRVLEGEKEAETLVHFARLQRVTHIFLARPHYTLWKWFPESHLIHEIVRLASDIRLTIVAERRP